MPVNTDTNKKTDKDKDICAKMIFFWDLDDH